MCVCVTTHNCRLTHWNHKTHSNTAIVLNFADFPKNASFKSYGVVCLPRDVEAGEVPHPEVAGGGRSDSPVGGGGWGAGSLPALTVLVSTLSAEL